MTFQVMIVEDNRSDAKLIEEAFNDVNVSCDVRVVSDGTRVIECLTDGYRPHIIFLDLNLASISGINVLNEIRNSSDAVLRVTPVILLTNSKRDDDIHAAYENGCNAYMMKPLGYDKIMEAIDAASNFWLKHVSLPRNPPKTFPPDSE